MKKLWLVAVAGFALSTSAAFAADLGQPYYKAPPPPVVAPNWAGVYIGVNRGYGWNRETGDLFCEQPPCLGTTGGILKPEGGLAGGQIGYNWQSSIVVYGIEADIQWADIHDSASGVSAGPRFFLGTDTYDASAKRFGTVRGRLGITPWGNNALLYVTGGLIYGGEKVSATLQTPGLGPCFSLGCTVSNTTTRTGGTVGLGLEYLVTPNLSAKIEGLWYDMGTENLFLTSTETQHNHLEGAIVRGGLNWHVNWFGGGGPGYQGQY
jgi:outer membrane immunogenic protein